MKTTQQKTYAKIHQNECPKMAPEAPSRSSRRVFVAVLTVCLVMAAIISGSIALWRLRRSSGSRDGFSEGERIAIAAVCNSTTFPEACVSSLSSHLLHENASLPQDLVEMSMIVAFQGLQSSLDMAEDLFPEQKNLTVRAALKDCLEVLAEALDQVNASIARFYSARDESLKSDAIVDAQTWMSSALTFQSTCTVDGFEHVTGEVQKQISLNGMHVQELLSNALALLEKFASAGNDLSKWKP